jgi:hypothetical protein
VGNRAAVGHTNPYARRQAELRQIVTDAVSPHVEKIALRMAAKAACGDVQAAQLLFAYLLGKPTVAPNPDSLDLMEWELTDKSPTAHEVARCLTDSVPAGAAAEVVQRLLASRPDPVNEAMEQAKQTPSTVQALRDKRSGKKRKASAALSS